MKKKPTELGKFLARLRIDLGISRESMSVTLGLSYPHLAIVEQGKRKLTVKVFKRIVEEYKLTEEQKDKLLIAMVKHNGSIELDLLDKVTRTLLINSLEDNLFLKRKINCGEESKKR